MHRQQLPQSDGSRLPPVVYPVLEVFSAGTKPAEKVNPLAVKAMHEKGIDISGHTPQNVEGYLKESWDYVITVCGGVNSQLEWH